MTAREDLGRSGLVVLLERVRWCSDDWWARVRARRSEDRCRARSSAEGSSPKMKNLMKTKRMSAMESCPSRKPCVKERLRGGQLRAGGAPGARGCRTHVEPGDAGGRRGVGGC
jgi:hypothetical protein